MTPWSVVGTRSEQNINPVGYYAGQVTDDSSSVFSAGAINTNRYAPWTAHELRGPA
jgi:hypothetical protein